MVVTACGHGDMVLVSYGAHKRTANNERTWKRSRDEKKKRKSEERRSEFFSFFFHFVQKML
jgi:hypothetical protein